jgi:hypothetical protein
MWRIFVTRFAEIFGAFFALSKPKRVLGHAPACSSPRLTTRVANVYPENYWLAFAMKCMT